MTIYSLPSFKMNDGSKMIFPKVGDLLINNASNTVGYLYKRESLPVRFYVKWVNKSQGFPSVMSLDDMVKFLKNGYSRIQHRASPS